MLVVTWSTLTIVLIVLVVCFAISRKLGGVALLVIVAYLLASAAGITLPGMT